MLLVSSAVQQKTGLGRAGSTQAASKAGRHCCSAVFILPENDLPGSPEERGRPAVMLERLAHDSERWLYVPVCLTT